MPRTKSSTLPGVTEGSASPPAPAVAAGYISPVDGLAQLSFIIHGILERRAADQDLSITQVRLLGVLRDRRPTMNELGKLLGLDKSSISGLVDRAERRGLAERIPSAEDRRAVLVGLTDRGRSLVSRAATGFGADVLAVLDLLPPSDRNTLSGIVSRLVVAYAASQGVDLLETLHTEARPQS
jgi:MarR family transcriptional regulator, lower aerobic nicotinate degradation pathway regulator